MATTPRKGLPFIWISWITGLLAGSNQCTWAAWYKARFKYDKVKDNFDLEAWGADHDAMVQRRVKEFEADGHKVRVENQNWLRVPGETAILVGKPDIIAERGGQFTSADGKTGDPSKKDWFQQSLYLYMIPKAWHNAHLRLTGEVFYKSGSRVEVHPEEFTKERKQEAFNLIRLIAQPVTPQRTPSVAECRFCDIGDCPERMSEVEDNTPLTAEF